MGNLWQGRQEGKEPPTPGEAPPATTEGEGEQGSKEQGKEGGSKEQGKEGGNSAEDGSVLPGPAVVLQTRTEQSRTIRCGDSIHVMSVITA